MQELILDRLGDGWGEARLDGLKFFSMENPKRQILAGTYKMILTPSRRAKLGTLWTCWPNFLLPQLLDDKGDPMLLNNDKRSGIRAHAANLREQLEGCVAFGMDRTKDVLIASQAAFKALLPILKFPCWITINDPKEK